MSVLFQVVAHSAIALVRAINVCTFLTAGIVVTFINIFTVLAIKGQGEASGTGALVGARRVITGLGAQAARVPPTLIYIHTELANGVILVAGLAVTAVAAGQVVTDLALSTAVGASLTFININTSCSISAGMVTPTAHDNLALTGVRAHSIYAVKAVRTWFTHTAAFIDVYAVAV